MIREAIAALLEGRSLTEAEAATPFPKPRLQPGWESGATARAAAGLKPGLQTLKES
jgi:hypothetical protein